MTVKKKRIAPKSNGVQPLNVERLESMLAEWAERRPEIEGRVFNIARECGLQRVVDNITRLRRYAKAHKG